MKINYIIILLALFSGTAFQSCNKMLDINYDPNNPTEVGENLLLPAILANFSYEVIGGYPVRTTTMWTKHLATAIPDAHEGTYRVTAEDVNNFWRAYSYIDVMQNCKVLIAQATENENFNYSAIGKIMLAWNMSMITDCFGDAPFSEAFKGFEGVIKPTYDTQEEIYNQLQELLDEAIDEAGRGAGLKPGADDFIYGGTMASWQRMARTLKARFHLRLSFAPGKVAATQADLALQALNAGAITSGEIPKFQYFSAAGSENPWYQFAIDGKWDDRTRPAQFYVNLLDSLEDPRLGYQVAPVDTGVNAGKYVGVTNDETPTSKGNYSEIHPFYSAAGAPLYWFIYAEVPLMRAEAEFLKANRTVTQAVIDAYNEGITASMSFYGIESDDYSDYLDAQELGADPTEAYKKIMLQKYIVNYLQFEAYNDFRRTGYPELPINNERYPDGPELGNRPQLTIIPLRMPYPSSERNYNKENIPAEIPAGFLEAMTKHVWWDPN